MRLTLAAVLTLVVVGLAQAQPAHRPILRLADTTPLALKGRYFYPRELVHVQVRGVASRRIRTTARGSFTVVFRAATFDRCTAFVAVARGARGDRAYLRLAPLECAPP
jgi:hypothetical protein